MKKKTLPKLKADLQKVFNKYIRLRDLKGNYFTCISCNQVKPKEQMNAGHFYSVKGYDSLRFNEDNVNGECISCNCFNESHLIGYTINLQNKIGTNRINYLHDMARDYKKNGYKWCRIDLEEMIAYYKNMIKELEC